MWKHPEALGARKEEAQGEGEAQVGRGPGEEEALVGEVGNKDSSESEAEGDEAPTL